jgi:predicted DNA-binding protein YlxM (UPF0122 family)
MTTLFERILLLENEDIVLVKDVIMARLMNQANLSNEERNIRLLKQIIEEYIRGKVPTIKVILLQDFIKMLDLILAKLNFIRSVVNLRQMEVLELLYGFKYGKCYSIEEIGQKFNVTRERVRQIKEKALQKLRYTQYRKVLLNSEQG